jgi:hypothetical protein
MADELAQPPPAARLGAIHGGAHAGGPEPEQGLGRIAVVAGNERYGRNRGELTNEPRHGGQLDATAAVNGNDERVHPLPPRGVQYVVKRVGMEGGKAAVSCRVQTRTFRRWQDCADGHHGGRG